jgi:hypothetical protein
METCLRPAHAVPDRPASRAAHRQTADRHRPERGAHGSQRGTNGSTARAFTASGYREPGSLQWGWGKVSRLLGRG